MVDISFLINFPKDIHCFVISFLCLVCIRPNTFIQAFLQRNTICIILLRQNDEGNLCTENLNFTFVLIQVKRPKNNHDSFF